MLRKLTRIGKTNLVLIVLFLGLVLTTYNVYELNALRKQSFGNSLPNSANGNHPKYTVYAKHPDSGYLKHVYNVFERAGFERNNYNFTDDWDVMWAHDYPFKKIKPVMKRLKPYQKVNKLPGSGFVTNKVNLATSKIRHIPKAFKIPNDTVALKNYASENPDKMFVQKNKNHRGIQIEKIENLDLNNDGSFVQEFVDDPFLIDGYKFDIGIYTMITSINPLRIYVFESDVLVRFCPEPYYPFDPQNKDKYVVHDDYRPTWKVPTLAKLYSDLNYSFKETLNAHIRSIGKNPEKIWQDIYDVITDVYTLKEPKFIEMASHYPDNVKRSFFEMVRFDFVLDSKLNVYLMEANMSPNLSSAHFSANRLLYEQVIYSLLRIAGVIRGGIYSDSLQPSSKDELEMQVSSKDISVFADECSSQECSETDACETVQCRLCKRCLTSDEETFLTQSVLEHTNRHNCKRIYPPSVSKEIAKSWKNKDWSQLSTNNAKMHQWLHGKCLNDWNWCH